jgi:hypothetical protein
MKHKQSQQVARSLAAATGVAAASVARQETLNQQLQHLASGMGDLADAMQMVNALQVNMVARLVADYRALAAAMAAHGITPDAAVFKREMQAFKAERGPGFMPEVWNASPDWLERMRDGPAASC